jgi:hypothetical protein
MSYPSSHEDAYDQSTLVLLHDVFESIWLAIHDAGGMPASRDEVARMIVTAHRAGLAPEGIKNELVRRVHSRDR